MSITSAMDRMSLELELATLREAYSHATSIIEGLMDQVTTLKNENSFLREDMAELETRLGGLVSEAV